MTRVDLELRAWNQLRDQLRAAFPDMTDEEMADTLDGATDLKEACARLLRKREDDAMLVLGIAEREKELAARRTRLTARMEAYKGIVASAMDRAGAKKWEFPDFTVSLGAKPRAVVVADEAAIPAEFWKPQPPRLAIKAIGDALKAGQDVAGAHLDNGGAQLTVRRV